MKKPLLAICLAVASLLALEGCKTPTVVSEVTQAAPVVKKAAMTAEAIADAIAALPTSFRAKVADEIAKYPVAASDLNVLATGVESLATDAEAHPLPPTLQNTVVSWVEMVPGKVGQIATGVALAYQVAYPALSKTSNVLVGLGEFIRSFEPPQPTAVAKLTSAAASRLRAISHMAYDFVRRKDE